MRKMTRVEFEKFDAMGEKMMDECWEVALTSGLYDSDEGKVFLESDVYSDFVNYVRETAHRISNQTGLFYDDVRYALMGDDINVEIVDDVPSQQFSSANTSINSKKLPRLYNIIDGLAHCTIVDYGCGRYTDHIVDWAMSRDIWWYGYDKYNQPEDANKCAIKHLADADFVFCSNVLNVIAEDDVIANIIRDIVRPHATTIITVYEGDRSGVGRATGADQYQRNCKKSWYVDFIRGLGYHAVSKNGYIMVTM